MENANFVENIATRLGQNATVKSVYGDPIVMDGKTIIPVAQVGMGFGGGMGHKAPKARNQAEGDVSKGQDEEGAGGGGGLYARAKGVYEVSATGTRFIPVNNTKQLLLAGLVGFVLRGLLMRGRG
ncbi:MAG TPA: spore germination protein GerW family protein [Chitinophagaceae bacterium]